MAVKAKQQYYADETTIKKEAREFGMIDELKDKLDSIEYGAQVNIIEEVQENGVPLEIVDKSVNVLVPEVIDNLYTIDPNNSLSAKQGKILYDMIKNLLARGRFLSTWNTATGLPVTNPEESPYEYKAGDYYIVGIVASEGGTNFRPEPGEYVINVASDEQETSEVHVSDIYVYDGEKWILLINSTRELAVDDYVDHTYQSTNPVENQAIAREIDTKQNKFYTVSTTSPSNPVEGDEWYDATNDKVFYWDGTQWKEMGGGEDYTAGLHISIDPNDNNKISVVEWSATSSALGLVKLGSDTIQTVSPNNVTSTAGRTYRIQANGSGQLMVNVPWTDNNTTYTAGDGISISNQNVISSTVRPVTVGPTAPANAQTGDLWYDTTKNTMFLYKNNTWTIIGPEIYPITKADYEALTPAEQGDGRFFLITDNDGTIYVDWENVQNRPMYIGTTAPTNPSEGYIWYDTTNDVLKIYNGTQWNEVGGGGTTYTAGNGISISNDEISIDTTVVATKTDLSSKQDTISDLATIRSGASAGATAIQPNDNVSELTNDAGYITSSALDDYSTTTEMNNAISTATSGLATESYVDTALSSKQDTLTAGANITIAQDGTISAIDTTYTAGTGIDITNGVISSTQTSAEWGNITGTLSDQTDLQNALDGKQDTISDLSTIRSNATAGKSASDTIATYGDIVTHDASEFATTAQGALADTAVQPGDNVSDLTNDAGYITNSALNGYATESYVDAGLANKADTEDIPTKTSDLTNDSGFITNSVNDLTNYYTKTQTYTKTEVDNLISSFGNFEVVASLPSVSTASEKTIYLLGPIGTGADKYEEWIVTEETTPGYFDSASTVDHDFVEIEGDDGVVWNEDRTIQYKYIGINNIHPASTPEGYFIQVDDSAGSNVEKSIYADTPMPFIWTDSISQQIRGEIPVVYGYTPGSFDIYYSDSELTWVPESTTKVWTKIGETSVDLSGYATTTALTNGLATKQDTLTAGDGIDIDANDGISVDVTDIIGTGLSEDANNNIIVDTTVVATQTDLSGKQDKATSGSTAPATTPTYIGQQYVDTTADKLYVATGTSSSSDWTEVGSGSGDMAYADFNWVTKTGATVTLDLNSTITPSANFTVNAPATIKDGQVYVLRVNNGATAYTMTLGTGITNPYSVSTTLTANYIDQFVFLAVGGSLELLPDNETDISGKQDKATSGSTAPSTTPSYIGQQYVDITNNILYVAKGTSSSSDWIVAGKTYTASDGIDIDGSNNISVDVTDIIGTGLSEDANNNIIVDTTVVATQTDLSGKQDKATSGSTAPSTTPSYVGQQYVDTTNDKLYVATGTSSSSDWTEVGSGGGGGTYTGGNGINIDANNEITIDTTVVATQTDLSGKAAASDLNTKAFYLSNTSDTTTAQAALDWYNAGKTPILVMSNRTYTLWHQNSGNDGILFFQCTETSIGANNELQYIAPYRLLIEYSGTTVTEIQAVRNTINFLSTTNTVSYTPSANYHPATKKYVDDTVSSVSSALSGKQDKATSGSTAPATTPTYVGQQYVNTTNDELYVATGTTSSSDWTKVGSGDGDMLYQDFNWVTKSGASITLDLNSTITASANFTVNAPSTIKDGQIYVLRVITGATAYTMTLGTNVTNPYSESLTLTANTITHFAFMGINGELELQPSVEEVDVSGKQDKATSGSTAPSTTPTYIGQQYVDTTADKLYVATGTSSSSDWMEVGAGGGVTIGTTAPSPASVGMLWYDTTSTVKALKCYDGSAWKIIGPEIVPISQSDYDLLSSDEKNNGKFYLITNASGTITVSWSDITNKPSDLTAAQILAGSSTTSGMIAPSVISASMPVLSTQTGNVASLKIWVGTQTAYNNLSSYDANTLYFTTNVVS